VPRQAVVVLNYDAVRQHRHMPTSGPTDSPTLAVGHRRILSEASMAKLSELAQYGQPALDPVASPARIAS